MSADGEPTYPHPKDLFAALQGELNSRASSRATINMTHSQVVIALVAAYVTAVNAHLGLLPAFIGLLVPLSSAYFVSLYVHQDLIIGLLNRAMQKIEERSTIPEDLRYYPADSFGQTLAREGRSRSHLAMQVLCMASPIVIVLNRYANSSSVNPDPWGFVLAVVCVLISAANAIRLEFASIERARFILA